MRIQRRCQGNVGRVVLAVTTLTVGSGVVGGTLRPSAVAQAPTSVTDETAAKQKARVAEEHWLALVDAAKWSDSWTEASSAFRKAVPEETWVAGVESVRGPLSKVLHRELGSEAYSTHLPGVPDGQYVLSQYRTSFEHKAGAVETVVAQMDADGRWRVSGYYIK